MLRRVMLDQYGGNYPESDYGFIIHKIAAGYDAWHESPGFVSRPVYRYNVHVDRHFKLKFETY